jgi:glycosyltransferase involved in cell wall biosynthesis
MKVLLLGNLAADRQQSMQRFTALLDSGLRARGHAVRVCAPTLRLARLWPRYRYGGIPKYLGYFDKFVLFPRQLRRLVAVTRPDVVHITDHANAVYADAVRGVPVLATCHDLLQIRAARGEFPQQQVNRIGRRYQAWILACITRLPHVACVSSQTRADVLRLAGLPAARVSVVANALNHPYQPVPPAVARARLEGYAAVLGDALRDGFIIHVGGGQWYKNRTGLLAIYAGLTQLLKPVPALVLVGPPLTREQAGRAATLGFGGQIVVLDNLPNAQLEALYNLAGALVFPSWQEGFGWPIAEAQACGCPVFAANRPPMTEVGGPYPLYFNPEHPAAAARAIAAAWPLRAAQRAPALAAAARWLPARMLEAYEAVYRRAGLATGSSPT